MAAKRWTADENEFIKKNYLTMSNKELADKFKVTPKAIEGKLRKLGLKRTKGLMETPKDDKPKTSPKIKVDKFAIHRNIRCRICFIVDGYTDAEDNCRFCGAKLFKGDVL